MINRTSIYATPSTGEDFVCSMMRYWWGGRPRHLSSVTPFDLLVRLCCLKVVFKSVINRSRVPVSLPYSLHHHHVCFASLGGHLASWRDATTDRHRHRPIKQKQTITALLARFIRRFMMLAVHMDWIPRECAMCLRLSHICRPTTKRRFDSQSHNVAQARRGNYKHHVCSVASSSSATI